VIDVPCPSWAGEALGRVEDARAASGADQAFVVAPWRLAQTPAGAVIGAAQRDDGDADEAVTALVEGLGAERLRRTLVAYVDCFAHTRHPRELAREIAGIRDASAGVVAIERDGVRAPDPAELLAGAGAAPADDRPVAGSLRRLMMAAPGAPACAPLLTLAYHRVLPERGDDPFSLAVTAGALDAHLRALSERFRIVHPDELDAAAPDDDDRPALLITFDDGYRDNLDHALPLLVRHGVPACVFAATGAMDGEPFWWEALARAERDPARLAALGEEWRHMDPAERARRVEALELGQVERDEVARLACGWDDLRRMRATGLVAVGAHTRRHASLGRLDPATIEDEVRRSVEDVERGIGARPRLFAFPHGAAEDRSPAALAALRRAGIRHAFTTDPGLAPASALARPGEPEALELPRLVVTPDLDAAALVERLEALLPDAAERRARRESPRRICVLSGISADNVGDDAMLVATVDGIRRLDPDARVVVLAESPETCGPVARQIPGVPIRRSPQLLVQRLLADPDAALDPAGATRALASWIGRERAAILAGADAGLDPETARGLRDLMGADGVVDCGGANLSPHWASYLYEKCLDYLIAARPLLVSGQGVDPLRGPADEALLAAALGRADEVTTREHLSLEYLRRIGAGESARLVGDDAVTLRPATAARRDALLSGAGADPSRPYVAVQYRHYLDYTGERHLRALAASVDAAMRVTGAQVVGVPMHFSGTDERGHLRDVRRRVGAPERFHVVEEQIGAGEARALLGGALAAFGISYHSAVLALASGTPFLGLYEGDHYEQKMLGLARVWDLPELPVPMELGAPELARRLEDLLGRREAVSAALRERAAAQRRDVTAARRRLLARARPAVPAPAPAPPVGGIDWGSLRRLAPLSREWGFDRGRPVDRVYIEGFLADNADRVRGRVLELLNDDYARRYGGDRVTATEILDIDPDNPRATIVDDLTAPRAMPFGAFDCVILTQVLPYIPDCGAALENAYRALAPGGTLLVTVPSIIKYHREPEDHWRFTPDSLARLAADRCPGAETQVSGHGNVLAAIAFLMGAAAEELEPAEIAHRDPEFPIVVTARIRRPDTGGDR
jgi:polysaccharide pyruvyl transferase WcaK-like protein/peptidoglycan/xylan/chitin deacetylase (PgdA/CDA1 family)